MNRVQENSKFDYEVELAVNNVISGKYGVSGERFLTTREFAAERKLSLVTAQRVIVALREKGLISLCGKAQYITCGRVFKSTPLGQLRVKNCNKIIGMHLNNLDNPFFISLTKKIQAYLEEAGYRLAIFSSSGHEDKECDILKFFVEMNVAGIFSCPGFSKNILQLYKYYTLPFVLLGRRLDNITANTVLVDNFHAGRHAAIHLVQKGYKSFAYIGFEELNVDFRLEGFKAGLSEQGYQLQDNSIIRTKVYDITASKGVIKSFLLRERKPQGIFCFHDLLAIEVVDICRRYRISIPKDVGVVGFDDLPVASLINPQLTTFSYRYDKIANKAVTILLNAIGNDKKDVVECLVNTTLNVRKSTSDTESVNSITSNYFNIEGITI